MSSPTSPLFDQQATPTTANRLKLKAKAPVFRATTRDPAQSLQSRSKAAQNGGASLAPIDRSSGWILLNEGKAIASHLLPELFETMVSVFARHSSLSD